ncbi:DUF4055 domain-containing protein [Pseudomonas sp. URMO17WK12:I11]|uniref:DUF4055 domain-containing protein n=1 Tax=Pseudomonas sp. URMO17WK12:I11 TaxID=1283291 RepID=UPI002113C974|nr:DUF4055 domain-containing protein [Pseudomonas sp. URMO17WK12:I11]
MSVSQRTLRCQKYYDDRELIRAVRGGTETLRAAGTKYLPKEPGESAESYRRRLARSFLTNYTDKTAKNLSSKPFTRPIVVKSERYQELADEYVKAVDGKGTSLTGLSSTVFEDALWNGSSFIAVDCAVQGGRPYAYHLSGDHILGYRLDEDDRLTEIRIQERAIVADGDWGEKEVCRVRVFKREGEHVTWSLYDEDGTALVADQAFALKEIPVVPVHSSAVVASGELFAHPPLKDLAFMNIQHFQESSDQSNILRIARVPVLFASGVADDASIAIGSEYAIKGESGADLKYVEHSGAAIGAGRDSLKDLEAKMQSYGSDMLENNGAVETATGRALRAGETNNRIAMIALNLASAVEKVLGWIAYFNKIAEPDFHVDINTEYGINSAPEELTALANARTMGDLSQEDYLQELKRRGLLRNDFSVADNADRLSVELA